MADKILDILAVLDDESQAKLAKWYDNLVKEGFVGQQTKDIPYHVSLAIFDADQEEEAVALTKRLSQNFGTIPVHISHMGIFAGGRVLYGAPDMNPADLLSLREAVDVKTKEQFVWTPHVSILMDEPDKICEAVPFLIKDFRPFLGHITKLSLCEFWPTREILTVELKGKEND